MNGKNITKLMPGVGLIGSLALTVAGCVTAQESDVDRAKKCEETDKITCVNIRFVGNCPDSVDKNVFVTYNTKFVHWQSVDLTVAQNPVPVDYKIYFDPFADGKPLEAKNGGRVTSTPVKVPATDVGIEFKYTVVGTGCEDAPLDPRFTVRR